jgi:thiol-disulfide isomerase/thioredoxin
MSCFSRTGRAQDGQTLRIGDAAPEWKDLTGTDDQPHSLTDFADAKVVVLCFTCNACPYSVDYEDRLIALAEKYRDPESGVTVIAINSNQKPAETLDRMKERAESKKFPFLYLVDETQGVATQYGAVFTPEFFVLNQDRQLIYKGAMDDKTNPAEVKVRFVELAIEAGLRNEQPDVTASPARGCSIPFKRTRGKNTLTKP